MRSWHVVAVVASLMLTLLASCSPVDEPDPEPQCSETKACEGGLVCVDGTCVSCRLDRECHRTEMCHPIERICVLRPCFGTDCEIHDDCGLGQFCVQGLCLSTTQPHPDGCAVMSCVDGEVCNEGERCNRTNLVCEEDLGCAGDEDCGAEERCHIESGRCEAACTPETAEEKCGLLRVCHQGACVDCVDDSHCGSGLSCDPVSHECKSLYSCSSNRDCEHPQVCNRRIRQCTVDPGPCRSNDDCAEDELCRPQSGECLPAQCPADRFSPNQSFAEAASISPGITANLTACDFEPNYYRLSLAAGDRFAVSVDIDPLIPIDVALFGTNGEELIRTTDPMARYVEASALVAGDHFIRISGRDSHVSYGLRVFVTQGTPCTPDDDEPNDSFTDATRVVPGMYERRTICPGDRDWYTLDVPSNSEVEAILYSTPGENPLEIHLYDSNGHTLLDSGDGGSEVEAVTSPSFTGSRAYILVQGGDPGVQNGYSLEVRIR